MHKANQANKKKIVTSGYIRRCSFIKACWYELIGCAKVKMQNYPQKILKKGKDTCTELPNNLSQLEWLHKSIIIWHQLFLN